MSKTFEQLKPGDTIFIVGGDGFVLTPELPENFGLLKVKTTLQTTDGKKTPITCLGCEYYEMPDIDLEKTLVSYLTAPSKIEVAGYIASVRIDRWSGKFERTVSEYVKFLCFPDVETGLEFLEDRFKKWLEDIKECKEINNESKQQQ